MRSAIIIVGCDPEFWERAQTLSHYLKRVAGIRNVTITEWWNRMPKDLHRPFVTYATRAGKQPLLLAYIGHGYKDRITGETGWSYGLDTPERPQRIPYQTLFNWIVETRDGPTLFLNDTCYAESFLTPSIRENPRLQISLIAGAVDQGCCYGDLTQAVIDTWMEKKVYVPRTYPGTLERYLVKEAKFGPDLDQHFFPDPRRLKELARHARLAETT